MTFFLAVEVRQGTLRADGRGCGLTLTWRLPVDIGHWTPRRRRRRKETKEEEEEEEEEETEYANIKSNNSYLKGGKKK